MEDVVGGTLRKVAKGAGIYLLGTIAGLTIGFVTRILVIRYLTLSEYGVLSFAWVILSVFSTLVTFGIPGALTRQASFFIGKGEYEKATAIMKLSALMLLTFSVFSTITLFISANSFATFFKMPNLSWVLKITVVSLPFITMSSYFVSVFQTYERADVKVIFNDILSNLLKLILVLIVVLFGLEFYGMVWAYVISPVVASIAFFIYFIKNVNLKTREKLSPYIKILLAFAVPILVQAVLGLILSWTDVFMIGYYLTPIDVALYNAARPLARMLTTVLTATNFLYFPLTSQLYGQNKIEEIGKVYVTITKWIMAVTTPAFLVMFLFPSAVLWILYGSRYLGARTVLEILALCFFIHILAGPNGVTMISLGEVSFVTLVTLAAAVANFIVNLVLIPIQGINGAALASLASYAAANVLLSVKLYTKYGIHPLSKNYVKPLASSFIVAVIIFMIAKHFVLKWYSLVLLFVAFVVVSGLAMLFTKSFDREDIQLLLAIEDRIGIDFGPIKRILKRFVR